MSRSYSYMSTTGRINNSMNLLEQEKKRIEYYSALPLGKHNCFSYAFYDVLSSWRKLFLKKIPGHLFFFPLQTKEELIAVIKGVNKNIKQVTTIDSPGVYAHILITNKEIHDILQPPAKDFHVIRFVVDRNFNYIASHQEGDGGPVSCYDSSGNKINPFAIHQNFFGRIDNKQSIEYQYVMTVKIP